ncbi:MAG: hypothetical protein ACXVEE_13015 [Polyangiales bacterium]
MTRRFLAVFSVLLVGCGGSDAGADMATDASGKSDVTVEETSDDTGSANEASFAETVAETTSEETGDTSTASDAADAHDGEVGIKELCFSDITIAGMPGKGPDYDKYHPVIGSHCLGTNHQDIKGVEQVVFLGDSVTVCTPNTKHPLPTDNAHCYRNQLAESLATKFSLDEGNALDWGFWKSYDATSGLGGKMWSGVFGDCSKWGARTDDFLGGGGQLGNCFPTGKSDKKTLFVFTMGGNDISALTKMGASASDAEVAAGYPTVWDAAKNVIKDLEDAVVWMQDPARFPKGSYVVMGNPYEFTDATGDVGSCPAAGLAGFKDWKKPEAQVDIVVWILENYMRIAVEKKVDLIFTLEKFCGHGYVATKATTPPPGACWLGPKAELWFDETCIHPSDPGHAEISKMFTAVVNE